MTHKEAIKNLTELQLRLINDNSEEATEYNKKIYDTLAYFITQTIPLSVIEKIHDALDDMECEDLTFYDGVNKLGNAEYVCRDEVHEIIDKVVKEIEK